VLLSQGENWRQRLEFEVKTARLFPLRWGFMFVKPRTPSDSMVRLPLRYSQRRVALERLHTFSTVFSLLLTPRRHQHLRRGVRAGGARDEAMQVRQPVGRQLDRKEEEGARAHQAARRMLPRRLSVASLGRGV
jgi:hypothetical protein